MGVDIKRRKEHTVGDPSLHYRLHAGMRKTLLFQDAHEMFIEQTPHSRDGRPYLLRIIHRRGSGHCCQDLSWPSASVEVVRLKSARDSRAATERSSLLYVAELIVPANE